MSSFFRGTTAESDHRFNDKAKAQMARLSKAAPPEFDVRVDMDKVCKHIVSGWVASRLQAILGFEDDVVTGLAVNYLETHQVSGGGRGGGK